MNSASHHLEQVAKELTQLPIDQLRSSITLYNPEEITSFIAFLGLINDPSIIEKTRAVIAQVTDLAQLESIGKGMNSDQIFDTINQAIQGNANVISKIPSIIIGLNHMVFAQVVSRANEEQLNYLKREGESEPIQHQLTILTHLLHNHTHPLLKEIDFLEHEIKTMPIENLSDKKVNEWVHGTQAYHQKIVSYLITFQNALSIAWHTNRPDLIDGLSVNKEVIQRYLASVLGHSESKTHSSTGLYALIEWKLTHVYGDSENENDVEALKDNEPAIEGLTKLGIWHVEDYWDIGLLPHVKKKEELLNKDKKAEILNEVKLKLSKIGLNCVGDLKQQRIFSKDSLAAYIKKHD